MLPGFIQVATRTNANRIDKKIWAFGDIAYMFPGDTLNRNNQGEKYDEKLSELYWCRLAFIQKYPGEREGYI